MTVKTQATPSQSFCKLISSDESRVQQLPEWLQQGLYALEIDYTLARRHNEKVLADGCIMLGRDLARPSMKEIADPTWEAGVQKKIVAFHAEVMATYQEGVGSAGHFRKVVAQFIQAGGGDPNQIMYPVVVGGVSGGTSDPSSEIINVGALNPLAGMTGGTGIAGGMGQVQAPNPMVSIPADVLKELQRVFLEERERREAEKVVAHPDTIPLYKPMPKVFRHKCPCCGEDVWFDTAKNEVKES